jgi:hypothetical protein
MNFQTILKGRTVQTLTLLSALVLAGAAHAQSYGSGDKDSAGSSGSTSGQSSQKPKKDYGQSEGVKGEAKEEIDRSVERDIKRDKEHKLDPSKHRTDPNP